MEKKIVSVSRRTDIPAFYGKWFMHRVKKGMAGYLNPFSGQRYIVSLKKEDVLCFVFWSKNFIPFMDDLKIISELGYNFYFNYTINGYPKVYESNVEKIDVLIKNMKELSRLYSTEHINWRYDPIILSDISDKGFHLKNFENIASQLSGHVRRCLISFVHVYGKVKKNFELLEQKESVKTHVPSLDEKIELANKISDIAQKYGIQIFSCCGDDLLNDAIKKAHCIDGELIKELFYKDISIPRLKNIPTRKECGCTQSNDIGVYNSCIHGCSYCYANVNRDLGLEKYKSIDNDSLFLGHSKERSDVWIKEMNMKND